MAFSKQTIYFFSTLALTALSAPSFAETEKLICKDPEEISNKIDHCMKNRPFVDYADSCLEKIEKLVEDQSKKMAQAGLHSATAKSQNTSLETAEQNYKFTKETLSQLVNVATKARDEVENYLDWIVLPDHLDDPEFTNGDEEGFLKMYPCYSETKESLEEVVDDFDDILDDLEGAETVAGDLNSNANAAKSNLTNTATLGGPAANGNQSTAGKAPKITPQKKPGESTITGTLEPDKEKK